MASSRVELIELLREAMALQDGIARDAREAMVDDASRARESFRSCARLHSPTRSTTHLDAFATTCADARARIGWTDKITNHRRGWVVILSEMSECTYITTFTSMCVYL